MLFKRKKLFTKECFYNIEKKHWEVHVDDISINSLYFFKKNDNYFLDPNNPALKTEGNMCYSVYGDKIKIEKEIISVNCSINNKIILHHSIPTVFLNESFISLKLDMIFNKYSYKNSHIITIEWIGPKETYYIMDNYLEVPKGETKISVNPHLKIDPSTMKLGIWNARILISNVLVKELEFKLSSTTYST